MKDKKAESLSDDLKRYAAEDEHQKCNILGVPRNVPDISFLLKVGGMKPEDLPKTAKVYAEGCCFHCSYLPEDPAHPPKFCPECGAPFVPFRPQSISDKGED